MQFWNVMSQVLLSPRAYDNELMSELEQHEFHLGSSLLVSLEQTSKCSMAVDARFFLE